MAEGGKKTGQRAWEQKLQAQQEDLDRRDMIIQALERKFTVMQGKADEFLRRDEKLKQREDRATLIEFKEESLQQKEQEIAAQRAELEAELAVQRQMGDQLTTRIKEFEKDATLREEHLHQRIKELDQREQRLSKTQEQNESAFAAEARRLSEKEQDLQVIENEHKLKKVQLSEEQAHIQRMMMDLRNKDEEHETNDKLMKDMQAADERSRRHLKWQEDELERQNADLRNHREDSYAESAALASLKERIEVDKKDAERILLEARNAQVEAQRREHQITKAEAELERQLALVAEETEELRKRRQALDDKEKRLQVEQQAVSTRRRDAEIDLKRANHLRQKTAVQETSNTSVQKRLQQREKSLNDWDDELDWRETEFVRSVESAMNMSHEVPSFSPSHVNKAIVDIQMQQMKEQYNAGARRRVISALQPRNRAQSAKNSRAASPLRKPRPKSSTPKDVVETREQELLAQSHRVSMRERSVALERDFRYLVGKVTQLQESATTAEQKDELMRKYFTVSDQVAIQLALFRDRDLGAEIALRRTVSQCPIADPVASPVEMVKRVSEWWREMQQHLTARDESILHERVEQLEVAVDILRKRCALFSSSGSSVQPGSGRPPTNPKRARSAQPQR